MAETFLLEILTPDRIFFSGEAESLVIPAPDGEYGVLAGHEPVVTALMAGELRYRVDGEWRVAAIGQGFAEVMPAYVVLLAASAERPEEIDRNRAEAAKHRAEERLRQKRSAEEYVRSQAALARAMARLKIKHQSF